MDRINIPTYLLAKAYADSHGGSSDYTSLTNKPQINSVELTGNKSLTALGIASASDLSALTTTVGTKADASTVESLAATVSSKADQSDLTALANTVSGKQDTLTFDTTPTEDSANPVTSGGVYGALEDKAAQSEVDDIKSETATVTGNPLSITNALSADAISVVAEIEPEQDLHGYSKPWSGGAGKNILPLTLAKLKEDNTNGTWSDNVYSYRGIDFTITEDDGGNVIEIDVNGTSNDSYAKLDVNASITQGSYKLNGISGGSQSGLRFDLSGIGDYRTLSDGESSVTASTDAEYLFMVNVRSSGITVDHHKVYPMLRLASVTDAAFEPYSNICPISGMTEVNVANVGENLLDGNLIQGYWAYADGTFTDSANWVTTPKIECKPNTLYVTSVTDGSMTRWQGFVWFDDEGNFISTTNTQATTEIGYSATSPSNAHYMGFNIFSAQSNVPLHPSDIVGFKIAEKLTAAASLGTTVYGGSVDVTEGSGSVTMANIASYDGETIGEPWLSSMDEYVSGATPTTGAQVVYTLATPTTLSFTSDDLAMLDGENTISTDAEEVSVEYIKDTLAGRVKHLEDESGELVHHYSTSEKIVGTWIDGSTVYEKTWDFGSNVAFPSNNWTDTNIDASNISKIINVQTSNTGGDCFSFEARCASTYIQLNHWRGNNSGIDIRYLTLQYTKTT